MALLSGITATFEQPRMWMWFQRQILRIWSDWRRCFEDLVRLKELAARPEDLTDLQRLREARDG